MVQLKAIFKVLNQCSPFYAFHDCSRGSMYEINAAYSKNREMRHVLPFRMIRISTICVLMFLVGIYAERLRVPAIYAVAYTVAALCFTVLPVMLYAYAYLSKFKYWCN